MKDRNGKFDVLCVGEMLADLIVAGAPEIVYNGDQTMVSGITMRAGGDSFNNAIDLAKLGNAVTYVGRVSTDAIGVWLMQLGRDAGIDMDHVVRTDCPHAKMNILINSERKRAFLYDPGTSGEFTVEDVDFSLLDRCALVTVGSAFHLPRFDGEGTAKLFTEARKRGVITAMDVTKDYSGRWNEILKPCYPYLDYFLPSIEQAEKIAGTSDEKEIAEFLLSASVRNVVVKLGSRGCYFQNREKAFYCGCYHVPVVETTGAGDAFVSGFLTGLLQGKEPEDCAVMGTACSASVIGSVGANTGMRTLSEILDFIRENGAPEIRYVTNGR